MSARKRPTLVIHGYFTPGITNLPVHLALRSRGHRTFDVPIPGLNTQDIPRSAALLGATVEKVLGDTGAEHVDLVGVSMGGVIAVHYVRVLGGAARVRRTVTLGSPLRGTRVASVVGRIPLLGAAAAQMAPGSPVVRALEASSPAGDIVSIWAAGDAVVSREVAHLPGVRLRRAPFGQFPLGHYQLVVDPRNLAFLADELAR